MITHHFFSELTDRIINNLGEMVYAPRDNHLLNQYT